MIIPRTRTNNAVTEIENIELKSPLELFKEFYVIRNQSGHVTGTGEVGNGPY